MPGEEIELTKAGIEQLGETGREMIRLAAESSAFTEAGGLVADELRFRRFRRQLNLIRKAEQLVNESGLSPHAVPLKTLAPLISWGSLEEDEEMSVRWANLLASASTRGLRHSAYPELLRQLDSMEAKLLDALFKLTRTDIKRSREEWKYVAGSSHPLEEVMAAVDRPFVEVNLYHLENLSRLALCRVEDVGNFLLHGFSNGPSRTPGQREHEPTLALTALGLDFVLACQPPGPLLEVTSDSN